MLLEKYFAQPQSPAAKAEPAFEAGDDVVEVNGKPVSDYVEFLKVLAKNTDKPLDITVERKTKSAEESEAVCGDAPSVRVEGPGNAVHGHFGSKSPLKCFDPSSRPIREGTIQ